MVQPGESYIVENVRISLQSRGLIMLVSTKQTVLIEEMDYDNLSFESFEASEDDMEMNLEE